MQKLIQTDNSKTTLIVRLMVGAVFLSEGIQKFLFPGELGAGRFEKIGLPNPEFLGPFVGSFEVICGLLILIGFLTRFGAMAMLVNISVAIISTKIPILIGSDLGIFQVGKFDTYGFWSMAHEARTDYAMWLGSIFLSIKGGGKWSLDSKIFIINTQRR